MAKYTDIKIWAGEVNISSTSDYSYDGSCKVNGKHMSFDTDGGYVFVSSKRDGWRVLDVPKYFIEECRRQIGQLTREDKFKYFEYDRDGIKRFTKLRYHRQEWVDYVKKNYK